jgi:hypothetical protein
MIMKKRDFLVTSAGVGLAGIAIQGGAAASGTMTRDEYRRYLELFNANDPRFIEYYHPDVIFELGATTMQGATTIRDFYANVKQYIKEQVDLTVFVADEHTVAVEIPTRFECIRDWQDSFWGVPLKQGQVMRIISWGFYTLAGGKFTHIKSARYKLIHDWQPEGA